MGEDDARLVDAEVRRVAAQDLEHSLLLSAGAGTGKTRALVDHYVSILASGQAQVAHIVAVTFTEKAAKEMKERIRAACRDRADRAGSEEEGRAWEQHERELENARIGTIHSLCARLLRENSLAAGLDPRFVVLEEAEASLLLRESVRGWVLSAVQEAEARVRQSVAAFGLERACGMVVDRLGEREDWEGWPLARDADEGALLAQWRESGQPGIEELVTSAEWQQAVAVLQANEPLDATDKVAQTRDLALRRAAAGADPALPSEGRLQALAELAGLELRGGSKGKWLSEQALQAVKDALKALKAACKNAGIGQAGNAAAQEDSARLTAAFCAALPEAERAYSEAKRARSALDFADLQLLARNLLRDNEVVRRQVQRHTRHLLVDEFQDTNRLQKEVLDYLAGSDPESRAAPQHPTFAVGDAKQSIYRFRGADVSVFTQTRADFAERQGCRHLALRTSFRSQPGLVAFANEVFGHEAVIGREQNKREYEAYYEDLAAYRRERPGQLDVEIALATEAPGAAAAAASADEGDEAEEVEQAKVALLREVEADWIARRILEACGPEGLRVFDKQTKEPRPAGALPARRAQFGDVAILFRSMSDVRLYERALRQHGVPYYVVAGRGLYARQEIRDVLSFLRVLENRHDEVALAGVLRSPFFGVSDRTLYWLTHPSRAEARTSAELNRPLWDGLRCAEEGALPGEDVALQHIAEDEWPKLQRARQVIESLRAVKDRLSLSQLIERLVADTGFRAALLTQFGGEQMAANVRKLINFARRYEVGGVFSLRAFIGMVDELVAAEEREGEAPVEGEEADVVKLMTIHKAKGLEWPIVIVPDLGRQRRVRENRCALFSPRYGFVVQGEDETGQRQWPPVGQAVLREDRDKDTAESRRIFYVGCTRARDHLILTAAVKLAKAGNLPSDTWIGWLGKALGFDAEPTPRALKGTGGEWTGELVAAATRAEEPERTRWPLSLFERHRALVAACQPLPVEGEVRLPLERVRALGPDVANRRRFTVTELSDYLRCPKAYELRYLRDLRAYTEKDLTQWGAWRGIRRGMLAHRALEYLGRDQQADPREVAERALKAFPLGHGRPDEVRDEMAELLARYMASETFALIAGARSLRTEARLLFSLDGALIEGIVDAVAADEQGQLHLVDYKTGHSSEGQALHGFQLALYCAGLEAATGRLPASAVVHYLDADSAETLDVPSAAAEACSRAVEALGAIQGGDFPPCKEGCQQCGWQWACQSGPG